MKKKSEKSHYYDIDTENLTNEWRKQPSRFKKAAIKLVRAKAKHEVAKADLNLTYAELFLLVKENPADYDMSRVSDDAVKQKVLTLDAYKKAQRQYFAAKEEMEVREVVVNTLDHKKKAIEGLTTLTIHDLLSSPKLPKHFSREAMEDAAQIMRRKRNRKRAKRFNRSLKKEIIPD